MATKEKAVNKEINNWFLGDRDFNVGLSILEETAPNMRTMIKHIRRKDTPESRQHLTYQLFKLSGLKDESICYKKIEVKKTPDLPIFDINKDLGHDDINEFNFGPTDDEDKIFFDKIVSYQKTCYNSRAVLHKAMVDLGDINSQDIISKREAFLNDIDNFTKVVDYLHNQKLQWKETGVKPDETILEWQPTEIEKESVKPTIIVEEIPDLEISTELAKVRSRLCKYAAKIAKYSGQKLIDIKQKQAEDELLKVQLTDKLSAIRSK